jgi:putative inorganic carbon (hco3(-)) transporter
MSTTAIVWALLYVSSTILSVVNPLFGSLGYLLEYYMRPELKWWGKDLPSLRYNLIISVVFAGTYLIRQGSLRSMVPLKNIPLRWLLLLGTTMVVVTWAFAVNPALSEHWTIQWFKIAIIFPMLLAGVVRTPAAFNGFIAAHMLGGFWWGWDAWMRPKRESGRLMAIGSGDTLNDNAAATHLLTVLPFIAVYLLTHKDKRLRAVALIAAPFVINTLILCNSRGAMVGLAAGLAAALFLIRSGYRVRIAGAAVALAVSFLLLADQTFITRQQTTTNYQEDGSAQQRLTTWIAAYRLVKDRPFGAGGRGFHTLSPRYIPDIVDAHNGQQRAPHNTWVMVASEWGIFGLICFAALNVSTIVMLERLKRRVKNLGSDGMYYYWRALALQIALIMGCVAGAFTDRLYGESGYWMIGLAYALSRMQLTDQAEAAKAAEAKAVASEPIPVTAAPGWPALAGARPS